MEQSENGWSRRMNSNINISSHPQLARKEVDHRSCPGHLHSKLWSPDLALRFNHSSLRVKSHSELSA